MRKQEGFTLLSMMLGLTIFMVVLILLVSVSKIMVNRFDDSLGDRKEMTLFLAQLSRELHYSQSVFSSDNQQVLYLDKGTERISYKQSNPNRLIRQVNESGYDIVLQHAKNVLFQTSGNLLSIRITDTDDHTYYWNDQLYLKKEDGVSSEP